MSKPTLVFAPGAWNTPDSFAIVREQLHQRGWATEGVFYPSVGAEPPTKGLADDAAAVRSTVERLADEGKQVVLVVHSYGGLVGQNALEGLGYEHRQAQGKKGGVIIFVYLAAFVVPKSACIKGMLGGQLPPWMKVDGHYCRPENPETVLYHNVDAELQKKAIQKLQHISARVFTDEVTYEPWHEVPCFYFFCKEDQALPYSVQQQMAASLGANTPTFTTSASHSPFLSRPEEVVEGLEYAAKVGQERL